MLAGAVVLMVNALVGENGYLASLQARREHAALAMSVMKVQIENQQFKEQARRLKDDPAAIEEAAQLNPLAIAEAEGHLKKGLLILSQQIGLTATRNLMAEVLARLDGELPLGRVH